MCLKSTEEAQLTYLKMELHMLAAESYVNYRAGTYELPHQRFSHGLWNVT
jgi:hypothetical protein